MDSIYFYGITGADGLLPKEAAIMAELIKVYEENILKNQNRKAYYEDKNQRPRTGYKDAESARISTATGWIAKGVDLLAERSRFDGFTFDGEEPEVVSVIVSGNNLRAKYSRAVPSQLIHGVGFWTVERGGVYEPPAVISYHNGETGAAAWDYRHERIKYGFVIGDMEMVNGMLTATLVILHTDTHVVEIRLDGSRWVAEYKPHSMGVPMMVAMPYQWREDKPFGRSRVSRAAMAIVDAMQEELVNTTTHIRCYSMPQKYVTNLTPEQYDAMVEDKGFFYSTKMLLAEGNVDGTSPNIGMLQGADFTSHIAMQEWLAKRMASEMSLPVSVFGESSTVYTSNDSLRASNDALVTLADNLNLHNGEALATVMKMAMAIAMNIPYSKLGEVESSIGVHWKSTEMLTSAQSADASIKIVSAVPEYAGTEVFWERLGFEEGDRERVMLQTKENQAAEMMQAALFGEP